MKIDKKILYPRLGLAVLFVLWAVIGICLNSERITSVKVTLNEGGIEHKDKSLGAIGKEDEAPDYRMRFRTDDGWRDLGTFGNTWIGEGLVFVPSSNIPEREIIELQLLDDDKLENDVLEQFPYESRLHVGNNYTIETATSISLESGFAWFFHTPVGIAILAGITISIIIVFFAYVPIY